MHATDEDIARFQSIKDKKRRTYAAMVWAMDRAVGRVLAELDSQGVTDNTLIWFLSDNGGATNNGSSNLPLAGHKGIKFEGGIRVPMIMQWKKQFPAAQAGSGTVYSPMVSALDILPTCVAAAGADSASERPLDGVNLLPYLKGDSQGVPHQKLYWHKLWFSAMRDGDWKLIYVQDYGYALYNLKDDLSERRNLALMQPERLAEMTADLNSWKGELAEPLWREGIRWFGTHSANHIRIIEGKDAR